MLINQINIKIKMKCPKCNSENPGNGKFCIKCGYELEEFKKQEKEKSKEKVKNKLYSIKVKITIILLVILLISILVLVIFNVFGKMSHSSKNYETQNIEKADKTDITQNETLSDATVPEKLEITLTEENQFLDYDNDGLTNQEETELGTSLISSDTDRDGLTDYQEARVYNSNPLKYSTADDGISDYIKVEKDLDVNIKYNQNEIEVEEVKINYNVTLIPNDLESEIYGDLEEFSRDTKVNSTHSVFNLLRFEGKVEYNTHNENSILLLREGNKYTEFNSYTNKNGILEIEITDEDNYKDFVITTKENYEAYKND